MAFTSTTPAGVGIVGTGNILGRYLGGLSRFPQVRVVGCSGRTPERARSAASEFGIGVFDSTESLLASSDVDVVLNITPPLAHASTSAAALDAGKHVYVEKPMTTALAAAQQTLGPAPGHGRRT